MINVGIVFGGKSTEHDISIISYFQVMENMNNKYNIYPIYIDIDNNSFLSSDLKLEDFKNKNFKKLKNLKFVRGGFKVGNRITLLDTVIILTHGVNGEDGMVASLLEFYNIKYVGTNPYSSIICMDKDYTDKILRYNKNINLVDKTNERDLEYDEVIIKPARLGSSIGVYTANKKNLREFIDKARVYDKKIIIEKKLSNFKEYNIALYKTNEIHFSRCIEVSFKGEIFDFNDKYYNSNKERINVLKNIELLNRIKAMSSYAYEELNLSGIVRIDFLYEDDILYLNEINTIPGGLSYYMFDDFSSVLDECISYSMINREDIKTNLGENVLNIRSIKK